MSCKVVGGRGLSPEQQELMLTARMRHSASLRLDGCTWAEQHVPPDLPEPERTELLIELLAEEFCYRLRRLDPTLRGQSARRFFDAWKGPEQIWREACSAPPAPAPAAARGLGTAADPIEGRPLSVGQRVAFWCRTHPLAAGLALAALGLFASQAFQAGRDCRRVLVDDRVLPLLRQPPATPVPADGVDAITPVSGPALPR
jgi:hypothetical protein